MDSDELDEMIKVVSHQENRNVALFQRLFNFTIFEDRFSQS